MFIKRQNSAGNDSLTARRWNDLRINIELDETLTGWNSDLADFQSELEGIRQRDSPSRFQWWYETSRTQRVTYSLNFRHGIKQQSL
jgi:hypothetical protein